MLIARLISFILCKIGLVSFGLKSEISWISSAKLLIWPQKKMWWKFEPRFKINFLLQFGWNLILYSLWGKKKIFVLNEQNFWKPFLILLLIFPPLYSAWHACFIPLGTEGRHNPQAPPVFGGARFSPLSRRGPESFFWLTHCVLTATGVSVQGRVPDLGARACVSCTWRIPCTCAARPAGHLEELEFPWGWGRQRRFAVHRELQFRWDLPSSPQIPPC